MVHGQSVEEVRQDGEGLHTMRVLGRNLAWLLRAAEGTPAPEVEPKVKTNFIR